MTPEPETAAPGPETAGEPAAPSDPEPGAEPEPAPEPETAPAGSEVIRRRLKVSGRVQGVFYRETLRRMAVEQGVTGWARNTRDGLDTVLEGPRDVVEGLIKWCRKGPPHAVVIHVQVEEEHPAGEAEFRVR